MESPKYVGIIENCEYCGVECDSGVWSVHHLYRRSTHPHMINDPNNLMILCPSCHQYATDKKGFEDYLKDHFYGKTRIAKRQRGHAVDGGRGDQRD